MPETLAPRHSSSAAGTLFFANRLFVQDAFSPALSRIPFLCRIASCTKSRHTIEVYVQGLLKTIYLSGWEYNRVIRKSPLEPVASGLPAQIPWNGAAQLWMYETTYCTKEALLGDLAAYEEIGWTTGRIFADLTRRGFLTPLDWAEEVKKDPTLESDLKSVYGVLQEHYPPERIQHFLETGQDAELEWIELLLLSPICLRKHCVNNGSPNSLTQWISGQSAGTPSAQAIATAGEILGRALSRSRAELRAWFRLCDPPGTDLPAEVMEQQRQAEQKVQRPLIPALLSGALSQQEYHREVATTREVYAPVNEQLWESYKRNRDTLERLRDVAKLHLWPQLHNEWLPELDRNPDFLTEFQSLVSAALRRSRFDPYLRWTTDVAFITLGGTVGATAATLAGGDPITSGIIGSAAGGGVRRVLEEVYGSTQKKSDNLLVFFQKAGKL